MKALSYAAIAALCVAAVGTKVFWRDADPIAAQHGKHGAETHGQRSQKAEPKSALQPAEGASVKILSPKEGQSFKGDQVPLQYKLTKGKRGEHVHAYVDGELMGMFKSERGTITGIKPGQHTLELRVVAKDHQTELDASDKVRFGVK
jgi:hypothetical protein